MSEIESGLLLLVAVSNLERAPMPTTIAGQAGMKSTAWNKLM
jgi:hypothetical protein